MRVTRSAAIDRSVPIHNIYIDENNDKWIGNRSGVFLVHSVDYASEVEIGEGNLSLLSYNGGNYNLEFNRASLLEILKNQTDGLFEGERDFAGAFYDPKKKELWIGTKGIGVFRIKVEPAIEFI
jgi:ligand-binding sensor domain-containing protein